MNHFEHGRVYGFIKHFEYDFVNQSNSKRVTEFSFSGTQIEMSDCGNFLSLIGDTTVTLRAKDVLQLTTTPEKE